jgi:UDP-glucuronate 4-epimerase
LKAYVTGAAGFIGYHLCRRLQDEGWDVSGVDNFNDYYDPTLKRDRARRLSNRRIHVWEQDFADSWVPVDTDVVIHLAAYAGVRHSLDHPSLYIDGNIGKTQKLIDHITQMGWPNWEFGLSTPVPGRTPKVVYASTSCVMAGNALPWKEDVPVGHQLNPYGYSKRVNECQFMMSPIPNAIGLRFFTVYGPWGRPDMALFTFVRNILSGEPIKAFNHGNMIRDFTYVDDIVDGIMLVLNPDVKGKQIFNIGRGRQVNLMDFISRIEECVGKKAVIELVDKHPADTQATWSDTTKLQSLGYDPQVNIEDGVERFVKWYRSYYDV